MKRMYIHCAAFLSILILTFGFLQNPLTENYISQIKQNVISVSKHQDPLYEEIQQKAKDYEKSPQDAKVDKVWKATPGYNGLMVEVEKSYENMKKDGFFDATKLVYKEVSPSVHLSDLPPEPIYRGHPEKHMVGFLINVAWGNEYIPSMLETFKKHKVTATFFLEGRWVKENPELAKMIVDAGHEVGNHSYSHPNLKTMTAPLVRKQLLDTNHVIEATTGVVPRWFAPPSGSFRQEVVEIAAEMKMSTILWSVDTIDWQKPEPAILIDRVMKKIHPGALILMHPTESTAKSLDRLIIQIKEKQLKLHSVTNVLNEKRVDPIAIPQKN